MAQRVKMTVTLEVDGVPVSGFPISKEKSIDESQGFSYEESNDGDTTTFSAIPADQMAEIQVFALTANQATTYRFNGQTDTGIDLNAGGLIAMFNVDIDSGAGSSNASVNNNSGNTANVTGFAGGT
jgi:hypothetical protein|tara:strand:- start:760 stop:1137 length:378 start_codon:yes stop_codon:yes gene_type:complete